MPTFLGLDATATRPSAAAIMDGVHSARLGDRRLRWAPTVEFRRRVRPGTRVNTNRRLLRPDAMSRTRSRCRAPLIRTRRHPHQRLRRHGHAWSLGDADLGDAERVQNTCRALGAACRCRVETNSMRSNPTKSRFEELACAGRESNMTKRRRMYLINGILAKLPVETDDSVQESTPITSRSQISNVEFHVRMQYLRRKGCCRDCSSAAASAVAAHPRCQRASHLHLRRCSSHRRRRRCSPWPSLASGCVWGRCAQLPQPLQGPGRMIKRE